MESEALMENFNKFLESLKLELSKYPGNTISKMYIKTTMSPSIIVDAKA